MTMTMTTRAARLLPLLLLLLGVSVPNVLVGAQQSLLGGRFQTTTGVQGILNLALDVRDMKTSADDAARLNIYSNVRYFFRYVTLRFMSFRNRKTVCRAGRIQYD
jgi:hypothetical protein